MKPIIIAGNGPSLAQIDYSRLPQDFDVYRCNQFYFEDKYFLGKKIKGVFFNPGVLKQQYFTLHHLKEKREYEVEEVYCQITMGKWDREWSNGKPKNLLEELKYDYPNVKNTYPFLEQLIEFNALHKFYALYYNQRFTSGIIMLITAIAQGYDEIYLTGIDFYQNGGTSYAFEIKGEKNINKIIPQFNEENFSDEVHSKNVDIAALKLALTLPNIKLYSLSPSSPLSEFIPLALAQNPNPMQVLPKPQGFICDFVELPKLQKEEIEKEEAILPPPLREADLKALSKSYGHNFYIKLCLDMLEILLKIYKKLILCFLKLFKH